MLRVPQHTRGDAEFPGLFPPKVVKKDTFGGNNTLKKNINYAKSKKNKYLWRKKFKKTWEKSLVESMK